MLGELRLIPGVAIGGWGFWYGLGIKPMPVSVSTVFSRWIFQYFPSKW